MLKYLHLYLQMQKANQITFQAIFKTFTNGTYLMNWDCRSPLMSMTRCINGRNRHFSGCWIFKHIMLLYPLYNEVVGGYIGFTPSVRLSIRPCVCPASHVRSVVPTVLVGSISYLYVLTSNFRRCVACKVSYKIKIFGISFNFLTLILSCFDLGSDVNH